MSGFRTGRTSAALVLTMLFAVGCGTVEHKVSLEQGYRVQPGTKVDLGPVTNKTGQNFDINVEQMLKNALIKSLTDRNVYWTSDPAPKLILTTDIVEYSKGDAFKRWLMPGWGSTALVVRATLTDTNNRNVGAVDAKRTVDAGGGYTIGAWQTIFRDLAEDIVTELAEQVKRAP